MEKKKTSGYNIKCAIKSDTFEIDELSQEEIEECQFSKIKLKFFSHALNAYKYMCRKDVLLKYANTVAGKPILVYYNKFANSGKGDFAGHETSQDGVGSVLDPQEISCGFIPETPELTFEKDDNGITYACVIGYIWNVYYPHIMKVFADANCEKGISSELWIIDSKYDEESEITEILQFSITGITLLGSHNAIGEPIKPAVDGCKATVLRFSTEDLESMYELAKADFQKKLNNSAHNGSSNEGSFFMQKNKEDIVMEKENQKDTTPIVENSVTETTVYTEVEIDEIKYDDEGNFEGSSREVHSKSDTVVNVDDGQEDDDPVIEKNECVDKNEKTVTCAEYEALQEELNSCKKELSTCKQELNSCRQELDSCKTEYSTVVQQNAVLTEYKENKEKEVVRNSINVALNNVSDVLSKEQLKEWKEKSLNCSVENVDGFINSLKAFAFDVQESSGSPARDLMRHTITQPTYEKALPDDVWARAEIIYK